MASLSKIDVLGRPDEALKDDGETADQEVTSLFPVEGPAELYKIFEARRA